MQKPATFTVVTVAIEEVATYVISGSRRWLAANGTSVSRGLNVTKFSLSACYYRISQGR